MSVFVAGKCFDGVKNRIDITMDFWRQSVDKIIEFNEKRVLLGKGSITNAQMEDKVREVYVIFELKKIALL